MLNTPDTLNKGFCCCCCCRDYFRKESHPSHGYFHCRVPSSDPRLSTSNEICRIGKRRSSEKVDKKCQVFYWLTLFTLSFTILQTCLTIVPAINNKINKYISLHVLKNVTSFLNHKKLHQDTIVLNTYTLVNAIISNNIYYLKFAR